MTVVSIEKQKKHLTAVGFDNGTELLLDNDVCSLHCLHTGDILTDEKAGELKHESDYVRAKSRALWYLDRASHTEKALYDKLVRAGFEKTACAEVIARFVELGLVDDRRFAENFAERCIDSGISKREAVYKMTVKGVPRDIAYEAVDALDTDEEEQVRTLLQKKYLSKLSSENGTQKVYAALIRKGFSFSAVKNVLKKYSEELEYSEE